MKMPAMTMKSRDRARYAGLLHFDSLRELLELPFSVCVQGAVDFLIGTGMHLVAPPTQAGRLAVLDRKLCMAWLCALASSGSMRSIGQGGHMVVHRGKADVVRISALLSR